MYATRCQYHPAQDWWSIGFGEVDRADERLIVLVIECLGIVHDSEWSAMSELLAPRIKVNSKEHTEYHMKGDLGSVSGGTCRSTGTTALIWQSSMLTGDELLSAIFTELHQG